MTAKLLAWAMRRQPFRRFVMLLTDRRNLQIKHPENLQIADRRIALVWTGGAGEPEIVDLLHVVSLRLLIEDEDIEDQDQET